MVGSRGGSRELKYRNVGYEWKRKKIPSSALSETNMRTHSPRLLDGSKSSLDSVEVIAVYWKTLITTHAIVVSARVTGCSRDDVAIDSNTVGRRLKKPATTYLISSSYSKQWKHIHGWALRMAGVLWQSSRGCVLQGSKIDACAVYRRDVVLLQ
jgi:hypothetical protein